MVAFQGRTYFFVKANRVIRHEEARAWRDIVSQALLEIFEPTVFSWCAVIGPELGRCDLHPRNARCRFVHLGPSRA